MIKFIIACFALFLKCLWKSYYYIMAHCILVFKYDKHYINKSNEYFSGGRFWGISAIGWMWVVTDTFGCRRLGVNLEAQWPCSPRITVVCPQNIFFHPDDLNNFQGWGNYFQGLGKITIGHGTFIAANVGIITSNHSVIDPLDHDEPQPVIIGEKCWIGMNSMILPGVELGPHTTVGAGSIVTHSFPEGHCIIAGNPAKTIRKILNKA